jgi:hypothetical protein
MKVKALVRFNTFNIEAEAGDVLQFEREQDAQHLLSLGWVVPLNESKATSKKKS